MFCVRLSLVAAVGCLVIGCGCGGGGVDQLSLDPTEEAGFRLGRSLDGLVAHRPAVAGVNGLVTAGHPLASMAGMRILMQGGKAADAAVTVLAVLNQVEPMMSGAGGNGFVTFYDAASGLVHSLNATGAAPRALDPATTSADELHRGMRAGVVPGLVGGWIALIERFGTMTLGQVLEPAIEYAERGHPIDPFVVREITHSRALLERYPATAAVFLPGGKLPVLGQRLTYPDLARTLHKLVEAEETARLSGATREVGLRAAFTRFYRGDIAREMSRFYEENDGLFTRGDFAAFEPTWVEPVHTNYRGYDVYSSPPTSRGGLELVEQLNLIEAFDVTSMGHNSPELLHLVVESIKLAKADIYHFVTDPLQAETPIADLTSKGFAEQRRELISVDRAMSYPGPGLPERVRLRAESTEERAGGSVLPETARPGSTTSFSVIDRWGNVAVATPTLGSRWGTGVMVGGTGLLFNNGTRVGSTSPYPDHRNYVRGGQVPILNNAPTVVMKGGEFILGLGTPGGETIGQTQFQMLLNIIDFQMGIQEAIEAPRLAVSANPNFYRSGADLTVLLEPRMAASVVSRLGELGHVLEMLPPYSLGSMQGILRNPDTGTMTAGADPRRMMYAVGW